MSDDRMKFIASGVAVRRQDGQISFGTFREMKEGQPLFEGSELLHVEAPDDEGWHAVTSIYKRSGPAQVATPEYRAGHDRIFGKKVGSA